MLRKDRDGPRELVPASRVRSGSEERRKLKKAKKPKAPKSYKGKRRKGLMSKLFEEAFDVIEDIFD